MVFMGHSRGVIEIDNLGVMLGHCIKNITSVLMQYRYSYDSSIAPIPSSVRNYFIFLNLHEIHNDTSIHIYNA